MGKLLLVSFLGIHLPLIALTFYVANHLDAGPHLLWIACLVLVATLVGTVVTLLVQYWMLEPVRATARALEEFRRTKRVEPLPRNSRDELGRLMASARDCMESLGAILAIKADLARGLSHDLRSPLASVTANLDMMEMDLDEGKDAATLRESIHGAKTTVARALALVDRLLADALLPEGGGESPPEPVDPGGIVRDILEEATPMARTKGVELSASTISEGGLVLVDAVRLGQALANLVYNAIKFTPTGGSVEVSLVVEEHQVLIQVVDTGVGIAPERLQGVFKPVAASSTIGTAGEVGFGLGLWVARGFARRAGGDVSCKSELGRGSTFEIRLPRAVR